MILGTWGAGFAGSQWGAVGGRRLSAIAAGRARRAAARGRHRDLRRRPHRLRCRDQPARAGRRAVPVGAGVPEARATQSPQIAEPADGHACPWLPGCDARPCRPTTGSSSPTSPASCAAVTTRSRCFTDPRRPAGAADLLPAVADGVRPAAALLRRGPVRRRVARASTSTATSTSRSSSPARSPASAARSSRSISAHLPRGPDRRPRLHRPRRDDLRQLAARRAGGRRGAVRLHRRAAAAQRRARCTRCCCCSRSGSPCSRSGRSYRRSDRAGRRRRGRRACWSLVWYLAHRRGAAAGRLHDAVRHDAAGAGAGLAAAATAGRRRHARTGGAGRLSGGTDGRLGRRCARRRVEAMAPRVRAVLELPGRRRRPGRRRPGRGRLQRRERLVRRWACAPSAGWCRRCTRPAAAGWSPSSASTGTARC